MSLGVVTARRPEAAIGAGLLALILMAGCTADVGSRAAATGGDPERGEAAIRRYGCSTCHAIPGIEGPRGRVGPPLTAMDRRIFLAGVLPNTADTMILWISDPRGVSPQTLMPDMDVSEGDARDIAAYLYSVDGAEVAPDRAPYAPPAFLPGERRPVGGAPSLSPDAPSGDPERGRRQLAAYPCGSCHVIPGVDGADHLVGPPLAGIASRRYLAGRLPNRPDNVIRWVQAPQAVKPSTTMPDLGVTAADARDMAAYLHTLR